MRPGVAGAKLIRGAEAGSDHYLVQMKVDLKVRKPTHHEEVTQPKLRVSRLERKEVRGKFQSELSARFKQRRCKVEQGVEEAWLCFRDNVEEAAHKVVSTSRKKRQKKVTGW